MKQRASSDEIVRGEPKRNIIFSSIKDLTTSEVSLIVHRTVGRIVKSSTVICMYRSSFRCVGSGPAKSIENVPNNGDIDNFIVVRYFGTGFDFWQPMQPRPNR